jgi:hypothetical protein
MWEGDVLWPHAPACQWMIFLVAVGVAAGVAVSLGVGDGVGDPSETGTASKIRQHSRDRQTTRPFQTDKHQNACRLLTRTCEI